MSSLADVAEKIDGYYDDSEGGKGSKELRVTFEAMPWDVYYNYDPAGKFLGPQLVFSLHLLGIGDDGRGIISEDDPQWTLMLDAVADDIIDCFGRRDNGVIECDEGLEIARAYAAEFRKVAERLEIACVKT